METEGLSPNGNAQETPYSGAGSHLPEKPPVTEVFQAALLPLLFALTLWAIRLLTGSDASMVHWGIRPRTADGLIGIFTCPFIHADNDHLLSNTLPILVVGTALIFFYRSISLRVISMIWLLGGFWTWLMARDSYHIGASGLIYGAVVFLFFSGIFRKDVRLMGISFLVVFLYGSLAWGILPIDPAQSWEAHLTGSLAGLFASVYYRNRGPQRTRYSWEDEPEEPTEGSVTNDGDMPNDDSSSNSMKITYHYLPGEKRDGAS
ncbi:MAG: hypothetical protein RL213_1768 [Bacteroidota bacterium]|jgi:membrane associated rhomboid family serine protease